MVRRTLTTTYHQSNNTYKQSKRTWQATVWMSSPRVHAALLTEHARNGWPEHEARHAHGENTSIMPFRAHHDTHTTTIPTIYLCTYLSISIDQEMFVFFVTFKGAIFFFLVGCEGSSCVRYWKKTRRNSNTHTHTYKKKRNWITKLINSFLILHTSVERKANETKRMKKKWKGSLCDDSQKGTKQCQRRSFFLISCHW